MQLKKKYLWYTVILRIQIVSIMSEGKKEMFYLMMHRAHVIYSYLASDIW